MAGRGPDPGRRTPRTARTPPMLSPLAWAILAPFYVTAYGGFEQATSGAQWLAGLGIAAVVHLLLLPVFLGAGALERRVVGIGPRAAVVVLVILGISVARPASISALHALAGVPPVASPWWLRLVLNAVVLATALSVIHAVVLGVRRRLDAASRLEAVHAGTHEHAVAAAAATDRLVAEFERVVAEPVRRALDAATVEPFDSVRQEQALRRVAHDVVRPLSHHVFVTELETEPIGSPTTRLRRFGLPRRVLPATPWAPVAAFALIMYPTLLIGYGPVTGLIRLAAAVAFAFLGCWALDLVRLRRRGRQLAVLIVGYLVIGVGLAVVFLDAVLLPLPPPDPSKAAEVVHAYWVYIPLAFVVIAMLLVVARSEFTEARDLEGRLASSLPDRLRRTAAARLEHAATRERLARVLHNQVQGEIIALALRLRLGVADERDVRALRDTVDTMLADAVAPSAASDEPVTAEAVARNAALAIASWSHAIEVRSTAEPEVWRWLAPRPAAASVLLDAAVEGLTNAVRHDAAPSAELEFARVVDGVRLTLRTPGRLRGERRDGFGLADLRRRGAVVGLAQDGRHVVLSVEVVAA